MALAGKRACGQASVEEGDGIVSLILRGKKLYRAWRSYKQGAQFCRYHPLRLWVEPTNHCNLKCTMCPNGSEEPMHRGFMPLNQFKEIINQAAGTINDIHLCHRGESLLHPDIVRMTAYAHSQGVAVRLNTNGTLMTSELAEDLIEAGLSFISFSFDGLEQESYEKIRRGADFHDTICRIGAFLETKARHGHGPVTVIEALDLGEGGLEMKKSEFLSNFKGLPLDAFRVKAMHNWGGNIDLDAGRESYSYVPCSNIWYAMVIGWDGAISPCPQDWYFRETLGNIEDMPLMHAWNSRRMMSIRHAIAGGHPERVDICRNCDLLWREVMAGLPRLNLGPFLTEQLLGYGKLRRLIGRAK
ncbi:MAG: radical SAM protein [bacterium]|nr:radical SAM protein [bacterium]